MKPRAWRETISCLACKEAESLLSQWGLADAKSLQGPYALGWQGMGLHIGSTKRELCSIWSARRLKLSCMPWRMAGSFKEPDPARSQSPPGYGHRQADVLDHGLGPLQGRHAGPVQYCHCRCGTPPPGRRPPTSMARIACVEASANCSRKTCQVSAGHVAGFMRQDANDFIWRIGNHDRAGIDEKCGRPSATNALKERSLMITTRTFCWVRPAA